MADRHQIAEQIDALAVHCRPPLMSVEDRSRWTADWCEDLKEFPIDAIANACRRWRQGTNPKFPLLGQLLPLIRAGNAEGVKGQKELPWRPLSDAEYQALTVREKIRHRQIAAHEASREAGPMWRDGKRLTTEQMSPLWHELRRRSSSHLAEAKRLRDSIMEAQQRGAAE